MASEVLTDAQIKMLLASSKRVENPGVREKREAKHISRNFRVVSADGKHEFAMYTRQSTLIPENFSAGLRWRSKSGEEVTLIRCNGSNHPHRNKLERDRFEFHCHIHEATERYLAAGLKEEAFATPTDEYQTLDGALHVLVTRANIAGIATSPDHPDLFKAP